MPKENVGQRPYLTYEELETELIGAEGVLKNPLFSKQQKRTSRERACKTTY